MSYNEDDALAVGNIGESSLSTFAGGRGQRAENNKSGMVRNPNGGIRLIPLTSQVTRRKALAPENVAAALGAAWQPGNASRLQCGP